MPASDATVAVTSAAVGDASHDTPLAAALPLDRYAERARSARAFWLVLAVGLAGVLLGLFAAHHMESAGHVVTGMDNAIVWGLPHVFAIFMIVAASGVLNVASIGSVFAQAPYKRRAPLAGLLCIALLAGGLMVLVLDLGRPERLLVTITHINPRSVFAWNVWLYAGMAAIVLVYLATLSGERFSAWTQPMGIAALAWRFVLTTGTGSIFGLLVARGAYQSAALAPLFILFSFAWGLAALLIVQAAMVRWTGVPADAAVQRRMARLLGLFVTAALWLAAVFHVTNIYWARQAAVERFLLFDGGIYPVLLWGGFVLVGSLLPMALLFWGRWRHPGATLVAAACVLLGALAFLYAFIIGGQAFPLELFPGHVVRSSFADGAVTRYTPSIWEWLLGLGGVALAFVLTTAGVRAFDVLPRDAAGAHE